MSQIFLTCMIVVMFSCTIEISRLQIYYFHASYIPHSLKEIIIIIWTKIKWNAKPSRLYFDIKPNSHFQNNSILTQTKIRTKGLRLREKIYDGELRNITPNHTNPKLIC